MRAYVLVNVDAGEAKDIARHIARFEGVEATDAVN